MPPGAKALDIASSMYGLKAVPFKEIGFSAACLAPEVRVFYHSDGTGSVDTGFRV